MKVLPLLKTNVRSTGRTLITLINLTSIDLKKYDYWSPCQNQPIVLLKMPYLDKYII